MAFEAHYPAGGPYTVHFTPAVEAALQGSMDEVDDGVVAEFAADGRTLWAQKLGTPSGRYTRQFNSLTTSERTSEATFRAAVLGAAFDFKDGCGPVTSLRKVKFAPDGHKTTWTTQARQRQSVTWIMVDAD